MDYLNKDVREMTPIELAIKKATDTVILDAGGPFGAVIVKDGRVIAAAANTVLRDSDPTAHAEVNAIRAACETLKTHNLAGCELYATSYPCPMCMSAIIWSGIKKVYYGASTKVAEKIGFRDRFIYEFIEDGCCNREVLKVDSLPMIDGIKCVGLLEAYKEEEKEMY